MERIIDFKTTRNDNEKTVEAFLKEHGFTHQVLVNLKKTNNGITRNGIWAYTNEKISAGDKISVHIVENCNSDNILPIKIPLARACFATIVSPVVSRSSRFIHLNTNDSP